MKVVCAVPHCCFAGLDKCCGDAGHGLVMKIGDFGMSRPITMHHIGDEISLARAMSADVIGTAAYSAPELLLADSSANKQVDTATVLKSDVSCLLPITLSLWPELLSTIGHF